MSAPPERIHGWLDTQLSIARHFGGIKFQGHSYTIDYDEPGHPLVRVDVLAREAKAAKEATKADRQSEKQRAQAAQGELV